MSSNILKLYKIHIPTLTTRAVYISELFALFEAYVKNIFTSTSYSIDRLLTSNQDLSIIKEPYRNNTKNKSISCILANFNYQTEHKLIPTD